MHAVAQVSGCCYERENQYVVSAMPYGRHAARDPSEPGRWRPTHEQLQAMPTMFTVQVGVWCALYGCEEARVWRSLHSCVMTQEEDIQATFDTTVPTKA